MWRDLPAEQRAAQRSEDFRRTCGSSRGEGPASTPALTKIVVRKRWWLTISLPACVSLSRSSCTPSSCIPPRGRDQGGLQVKQSSNRCQRCPLSGCCALHIEVRSSRDTKMRELNQNELTVVTRVRRRRRQHARRRALSAQAGQFLDCRNPALACRNPTKGPARATRVRQTRTPAPKRLPVEPREAISAAPFCVRIELSGQRLKRTT